MKFSTKERLKEIAWSTVKYIFMFVVADTIMYVLVRDIRVSRDIVRWLSRATYTVLQFFRVPVVATPVLAPI